MIAHAIKYMKMNGKTAVNTAMTIVASRIAVESTSKYSAKPPQTPAIFLSVWERYNFLTAISVN